MVPPFCKNHCDCEGHDRRRKRPGAWNRGRRNPAPAALRGNVQEHYRTLSEIIEWLEESDAAEMHAAGLLTHSAARKALAGEAVQIATQGWATDPNDASPWAVFLEAIPTNMTSRLYQEVKQSLRRRGLPVYEFLSARPDPAQGGHGTSLSSSRLFSRSPPPQPASTSSSSSQMHVTAAPPHLPPSAPLERQRTPADASGGITRPSTRALLLADVSEELRIIESVCTEPRKESENERETEDWFLRRTFSLEQDDPFAAALFQANAWQATHSGYRRGRRLL